MGGETQFPVEYKNHFYRNFETRPKNAFSGFCQKFPQAMDEVEIFFANFQILAPLGCQGWVVIPQNAKKSQNHCILLHIYVWTHNGLCYCTIYIQRERGKASRWFYCIYYQHREIGREKGEKQIKRRSRKEKKKKD